MTQLITLASNLTRDVHGFKNVNYSEVILHMLHAGAVGKGTGFFFQLPWMRNPATIVFLKWKPIISENIGGVMN